MDNRSGPGAVTDVAGMRVGSVSRTDGGHLTGTTVVLPPPGTVAGVDVRGGGPGTHETDALAPGTLVSTADAVVHSGGSAYGLATADGARGWCEEAGRGFPVGAGAGEVVPIVPAAVVYDLGRGGDFRARPLADWGYRAAELAHASGDFAPVERGCVGAGTGALLARGRLKGGLGTASLRVDLAGVTVTLGALAVVNAFGVPLLPGLEELRAGQYEEIEPAEMLPGDAVDGPPGSAAGVPLNTTIAVLATDAGLDVPETTRAAACAHDGLARMLDPVHTLSDGDTVFGLATGRKAIPSPTPRHRAAAVSRLQAAAAEVMARAIEDAVRSATTVTTPAGRFPSYRDHLADAPRP
jgi:L-aminopeptidase/D-esterase-like protein